MKPSGNNHCMYFYNYLISEVNTIQHGHHIYLNLTNTKMTINEPYSYRTKTLHGISYKS